MRPNRCAAFVVAALAACSSGPGVYPIRELGSGTDSGLTVPLQRVFRSDDELRRFAGGLRAKGNFPASLTGIDWSKEMVVVAIGGDSEPGERMSIVSTNELRGVLFVTVKKSRVDPSHPFVDEPAPRPTASQPGAESEPAVTTPYVLAALPRFKGTVRFVTSTAGPGQPIRR